MSPGVIKLLTFAWKCVCVSRPRSFDTESMCLAVPIAEHCAWSQRHVYGVKIWYMQKNRVPTAMFFFNGFLLSLSFGVSLFNVKFPVSIQGSHSSRCSQHSSQKPHTRMVSSTWSSHATPGVHKIHKLFKLLEYRRPHKGVQYGLTPTYYHVSS